MRVRISLIILLMMVFCCINVTAGIVEDDESVFWEGEHEPIHDEYGIAKLWFSTDKQNWEEATAHPTLKKGEPFYIKLRIKPYTEEGRIDVSMSTLDDPLEDYELLEEPDYAENAELLTYNDRNLLHLMIMHPEINETHEYIWKARVNPDTDWGGGSSPINFDIEYTYQGGDYHVPPLTFAAINILDEYWEGYDPANPDDTNDTNGNNDDSASTPGFEVIMVFASMFIFLVFIYRKKT